MRLSTGITIMLSVALGVWCDARMQPNRYANQMTALQISQCTKADRLGYGSTK